MVFGFQQSSHDAVLFIDDENHVIKQMLFSEFQAVLDGIIGEPEFADTQCRAVYIKVNYQLQLLAAVFFLISFESNGAVDRHWNLPLEKLAETAAFGPTIDGKAIRMSSKSQCQIPWHHEHMWEPNLAVEGNTLKRIALCLKENRLALPTAPLGSSPANSNQENQTGQFDSVNEISENSQLSGMKIVSNDSEIKALAEEKKREAERYQMAQNIKKQRLYIASLKARHEEEVSSLRGKFSNEKESMLIKIEDQEKSQDQLLNKIDKLSSELESLKTKRNQSERELEKQLSESSNTSNSDYVNLQNKFKKEMEQKLIEQKREFKEKIEMQEMEAAYRESKLHILQDELNELQRNITEPQQKSLTDFAEVLEDAGVNFVVTLPTLSPLSIPAKSLAEYKIDPEKYVADRLGLDVDHYKNWLEHANNPVCKAEDENGHCCNRSLVIESPGLFIKGISDRCEKHQRSVLNQKRALG